MTSIRGDCLLLLLLSIVLCGCLQLVHGQACQRPDRRQGNCVSVRACPDTMQLLEQRGSRLSPSELDELRRLQCQGDSGSFPWICCALKTDGRVDTGVQWPGQTDAPQPVTRAPPTTGGDTGGSERPRGGALAPRGVCGLDSFGQRIYGGQDAGLTEFPWMALLQYRSKSTGERKFNCGGALINSRYILTAAHCLVYAKSDLVLDGIRLGEYDLNSKIDCIDGDCADPPVDVAVAEFVAHPQFDMTARNQANDIGLVRLAHDVPYTEFVQPVCLPATLGLTRSAAETLLYAAGWGRTLQARQSAVKQKVQLPVVDQDQCRAKYTGIRANILDSQLCAGSLYAVDTCDGDSGGPLMAVKNNYWTVEGIVSFGRGCGLEGWPAIYTRVASFDEWILATIRD